MRALLLAVLLRTVRVACGAMSLQAVQATQAPSPVDAPPAQPQNWRALQVYTPLTPGVTLHGFLPTASTSYYSFSAPASPWTSLSIVLTSVLGDVDLYGNLKAGAPGPTGAPEYSSTNSLAQSVDWFTVTGTESFFKTDCPPAGTCNLQVAIKSNRPSNYTIVAVLATGTNVLKLNVPWVQQTPILTTGTFTLPLLVPITTSALTILFTGLTTVNPYVTSAGSLTAYIGKNGTVANASSYCARWFTQPINPLNSNSFQFDIRHPCWCDLTLGLPCALSVVVVPTQIAPGANYIITATSFSGENPNGYVQLLDGQTTVQRSLLSVSYNLYTFTGTYNTATGPTNTVISLDTLNGDCDLYITVDGTQPSTSNYDYASHRNVGPDIVQIDVRDPVLAQFCSVNATGSGTCTFLVAVHGWANSNMYTLTASASRYTTLTNNLPTPFYTQALSTSYFTYPYSDSSFSTSVVFSISPSSGAPLLLVGDNAATSVPVASDPATYYASTYNYVAVPPTAPFFVNSMPANWFLGAAAVSTPARYTLQAKATTVGSNNSFSLLSIGSSQNSAAQLNKYDRWYMPWPVSNLSGAANAAASVIISVLAFDSAEVYTFVQASASPVPGANSSTAQFSVNTPGVWIRFQLKLTDIVPRFCINFLSCYLTIPVLGTTVKTPANYAVYQINSWVGAQQLTDGVTTPGVVDAYISTMYTYTAASSAVPITVYMTNRIGSPDVYVAVGPGSIASPTNYHWMSKGRPLSPIIISFDDPVFNSTSPRLTFPLDFSIAVYGWDGPATYYVQARSGFSPTPSLTSSLSSTPASSLTSSVSGSPVSSMTGSASSSATPVGTNTCTPTPTNPCPPGYTTCTPFFLGSCGEGYITSTCGSCVPVTPTKSSHATGSPTKSSHATSSPTKSSKATSSLTKSGAPTHSPPVSQSPPSSPTKSPKATMTSSKTPTYLALRELKMRAASHTPTSTPGCSLGQYAMGSVCGDCPLGYTSCGIVYSGTCELGFMAVPSTPGAPGFLGLTCGSCVPITPTATVTKLPPSRTASSQSTATSTQTRSSTGSSTPTRSASKPATTSTPSRSGTRPATPSKTQGPA